MGCDTGWMKEQEIRGRRSGAQASRAHRGCWEGELKVTKVTSTCTSTCHRCTYLGGFLFCVPRGWDPSGEGKEDTEGHECDTPMLIGLSLIHTCSPQMVPGVPGNGPCVPRLVTLSANHFLPCSASSNLSLPPHPPLPPSTL